MNLNQVVRFLLGNASAVQYIVFGLTFGTAWAGEMIVLAQPAAHKLRHTAFNLVFLTGVLPVQFGMMAMCIAVANWVTVHHWGLIYFLPDWDSPWIKYGLTFLLLDFLDYVYHNLAHRVGFMWRFHLIHHSDEAVDVSTTFREHPCETAIRVSFLTLWVFLCGASLPVLILRQTFETFANVSQHINFRLPPRAARIAGWLFVTPNLHHAHHHFRTPGTDCNYGDIFSIWDRLFGTYVELQSEPIVFGLETHLGDGAHRSLLGLLGLTGVTGTLRRFATRARDESV